MCSDDVRIMAWVKPFVSFKPNVNPAYAWEPVLVHGGRKRTREQITVRDFVSCGITLRRGLHGVKPETFAYWLFQVLNIQDGDTLDDLFPGSGAITKALERYRFNQQLQLMILGDTQMPRHAVGHDEGALRPSKGPSRASQGR